MWTILKAFVEFITTLLLFYVLIFGPEACGALVPQPGIELALSALEGEILTPGPPGKPLHQHKFWRMSGWSSQSMKGMGWGSVGQ